MTNQNVELRGISDLDVLEWVASQERLLLTHDINTIPAFAKARVNAGLAMSGVAEVAAICLIGNVIDDILLLRMQRTGRMGRPDHSNSAVIGGCLLNGNTCVQRLPRITESRPTSDVLHGIHKCARNGMEILDLPIKPRPSEILEALDDFVFHWRKGYRPEESVLLPEDLPFTMGSLWGEVLIARFKWEWVKVMFHEHGNSVAHGVVAPDRSLAVFPMHFLIGCLKNPSIDVTIMLSYNMLKGGKIAKVAPFSYFNLMDGVHRIVPRE